MITKPSSFDRVYIDGDEILYNAGFASEHTHYEVYIRGEESDGWIARYPYKRQAEEYMKRDDDLYCVPVKEYDNLHLALYNTRQYIERVRRDCRAEDVLICFSGDTNFRDRIARVQVYKGNRDESVKPRYYSQIKEFVLKNYPCEVGSDQEADDLLGIYGYRAFQRGLNEIIATKDKDLNMIPGWRYHSHTKEVSWVSEVDGWRSFYTQLLTGDSTDNIPGIYRTVGVRARPAVKRIINESEDPGEMLAYVWYEYWFNSSLSDRCVTNLLQEIGDLLYIRRNEHDRWRIDDV